MKGLLHCRTECFMQLNLPAVYALKRAMPSLLKWQVLLQLREILEKLLADDADMKQMSLTARQAAGVAHATERLCVPVLRACGLLSRCACLTGCCCGMLLPLRARSRRPRCMPA